MRAPRPWQLLGVFLLFTIGPLALRPFWIPDESRYAEIAREMLQSGDWVVPRLLGLPYFEKPVAGYWFTALSQSLFGESFFAARLPVALATALSALTVGMLAHRMWGDERKTWLAVFIYLSSGLVTGMSLYITLDPLLAFWLNLALLAFHVAVHASTSRGRLGAWTLMGAACAMAFLTKGFIGWLLPLLVAGAYMAWQRRLRELFRWGPLAALVAAGLSAPWALAVHRQAPDFWNFFFWNEHVRRLAAPNAQHSEPMWFYVPVMALGCIPWLGLAVPAMRRAWADRRNSDVGFLLIWLLLPLVFLSLARGKLPTYVLPCFTPLALLMAHALGERLGKGAAGRLTPLAAVNAVLAAVGLLGLAWARRRGVYSPQDDTAWLLALVIGLAWLSVAIAQWRMPSRYWFLSALPPLLLWASLPALLTQDQTDSKHPSPFIQANLRTLQTADKLLGNDVGLSANLAWELKRSDIVVYSAQGELDYGLATAAGRGRFVSRDEIAEWIGAARRTCSVALVLRVSGPGDPDLAALPEGASERTLRNRLALVFYPRIAPP
jgi:4-amino-4-deoxy-L-arabinose transferase